MAFFNSAVDVLQTLVVALGAGLGIWGVINLMEGYGNDNPGAKSQGMKQVTGRTTLRQMLMCGKVTNDNLIDSSHYFRNTDQYEKLMWGFSYISFCLSKHFWESDVFVSFLLTASL